jgi:hypothetical protein
MREADIQALYWESNIVTVTFSSSGRYMMFSQRTIENILPGQGLPRQKAPARSRLACFLPVQPLPGPSRALANPQNLKSVAHPKRSRRSIYLSSNPQFSLKISVRDVRSTYFTGGLPTSNYHPTTFATHTFLSRCLPFLHPCSYTS